MPEVTIPNQWEPRDYQLDALVAFEDGKRRQMHVWHRRAGKDSFALNLGAIQAHAEIGTYWHLFPMQAQARKAIWRGIDMDGTKTLDRVFPQAIRRTTRDQEMSIDLKCGSMWQMAGSDSYDSLVGSNVKGVVFSEWALCDPAAWDYIRPIILANDGWAAFITTYRGQNHAYKMFKRMSQLPDWFCSLKTVNDTRKTDGSPVLSPAQIQAERDEGMSEAMIQQEYYCSPMAAFEGAYWADQMNAMRLSGRIGRVAYESQLPVIPVFDLGWDDDTACIMFQELGNEVRIINAMSWRKKSIPEMCADMNKTGYLWGTMVLPHDARVHGMNTGDTRESTFQKQGFTTTVVAAPPGSLHQSIEQVRNVLPRTHINEGLERLIDALCGYRAEEAAKDGMFQKQPAHTWESHYAAAMRYYAMSRGNVKKLGRNKPLDYSLQDRAVI